ncbi:hypothetical protein PPH41_43300 [Burkholderia gladioli]|nr:hypothetical protein [Burkholderia gladioli]
MVAAAIVGSAAVGAVGSSIAGSSAAGAQEDAANSANATQLQMFNTSQQDLAPYMKLGTDEMPAYQQALTGLSSIAPFSFNGNDLSSNPGFQFASTQGLKSVQNQMAARGLGYSGAQIKGAENYETGLANQYYQNYYDQALQSYQTNYNVASGKASALSGAVQIGGNAAAGAGNNAINTGNSIAANTIGAGNASAASSIATGNALSGAASSIGSSALLSQLLAGQGSAGMYSTTPAVAQGTTNGLSNAWGLG